MSDFPSTIRAVEDMRRALDYLPSLMSEEVGATSCTFKRLVVDEVVVEE